MNTVQFPAASERVIHSGSKRVCRYMGMSYQRKSALLKRDWIFAVKLEKNEFIGKDALLSTLPARKRIGLKVTGRGIVREHSDVYKDGSIIGKTTSGTYCPYIGYPAAMALVTSDSVDKGDIVSVDVRGRMVETEVVNYIFIKDHRRQL